jgi:hypothetical protein
MFSSCDVQRVRAKIQMSELTEARGQRAKPTPGAARNVHGTPIGLGPTRNQVFDNGGACPKPVIKPILSSPPDEMRIGRLKRFLVHHSRTWRATRNNAEGCHKNSRLSATLALHQFSKKNSYLSPGHALFINGFRIPVKDLANGSSVVPAMPTDMETIEHFQIVFDTHEAIWAEGVPAETFAANDKTAYEVFTNFVEYERLYRTDSYAIAPFPRVSVQSGRI